MSESTSGQQSRLGQVFSLVTLQSILSDLSHFVALERIGHKVTERIHWHAETDEPKIALTFDDGPEPEWTPALLDILAKNRAKATFFLIGRHVEENFGLAQQVAGAGHEIANHTFTHPLLIRLNEEEIAREITRTDALLRTLDGVRPRFLRPPMGLFSRRVLDVIQNCGYETVVGNVYPRDSHLPGAERIVERVLSRVENGAIIILHDGGNSVEVDRTQTLAAVEKLLPMLQKRGFQFVTLSELLAPKVQE